MLVNISWPNLATHCELMGDAWAELVATSVPCIARPSQVSQRTCYVYHFPIPDISSLLNTEYISLQRVLSSGTHRDTLSSHPRRAGERTARRKDVRYKVERAYSIART